ncbi:hypothetical protein AOQ84DRAFT_420483 [Glonium stellatum]|uniref:Uncharacterized protein n=1 Tax=Glonium stellatum TaxID=574774 RepID=A0A8E2FD43_9PEZI|nr:hypothetical protein AOQ84DRAFT_420483 [Glonium stellatum]
MVSPTRPILLIIYHSPLFPAHWSLYIHSARSRETGTRIHVTGDLLTGFTHEFVRHYNLRAETRSYSLLALGSVPSSIVEGEKDEEHSGEAGRGSNQQETIDQSPRNALERVAMRIEAPGKSLRGVACSEGRERRVEVKNCQTWLKDLVQELVGEGMLGETALEVVDGAPKH